MTNGHDEPYYSPYYNPYGQFWSEAMGPPHIGHSNHLCDMVEKGVGDMNTFRKLTKNPKFICKKCGRAAAKEENLCEPVPL